MIRTVLADISDSALVHERVANISKYTYGIMGDAYLDKRKLIQYAASYLKQMKASLTFHIKQYIIALVQVLWEIQNEQGNSADFQDPS